MIVHVLGPFFSAFTVKHDVQVSIKFWTAVFFPHKGKHEHTQAVKTFLQTDGM